MGASLKPDEFYEAIQLLNGDIFVYRNGFQEEADPKDVFKFTAGYTKTGQPVYQFSRFDFNPATPAEHSRIRLNRSVVTFAWYVDPNSPVIRDLKRAALEMDASKSGLILPGQKGLNDGKVL
jgi:hypothetical protein